MKLIVYIDSFNLYYGCLKKTPYRWLDVNKMSSFLFPNDEIVLIKYFTAPIGIREGDLDHDAPTRQQIYFRALRTLKNLEIIEGFFLKRKVFMKKAEDNSFVEVIKYEEKGTDVNIATQLVHDAHENKFERAVVISNDSDLVAPILLVKEKIGLPVTIISPYKKNNITLKEAASDIKTIRQGLLKVSQFSEELQDEVGSFFIPNSWKNQDLNEK